MGNMRIHNCTTDSRRIFRFGGGVEYLTREVWLMTKTKRPKAQARITYQQQESIAKTRQWTVNENVQCE